MIKDILLYEFFALRYLYSIPKNRQDFKIVYPPKLFLQFVGITKISRNMVVYQEIVETFVNMQVNFSYEQAIGN